VIYTAYRQNWLPRTVRKLRQNHHIWVTAMIVSVALFVLILAFCGLYGQEPQWPQDRVIGVIGASFESCEIPLDTPFNGMGLAGCSYTSLTDALKNNHDLTKMGFKIRHTAQAGAYSYDVPNTGWLGMDAQYLKLKKMTYWAWDKSSRLDYLVIGLTNDCLHSTPCDKSGIQRLIDNKKQVVLQAQKEGIKVIVLNYPEWHTLDLDISARIFGFKYIIDEAGYHSLRSAYDGAFNTLPGIAYLTVWNNKTKMIIDGLHPDEKSQHSASDDISDVILRRG